MSAQTMHEQATTGVAAFARPRGSQLLPTQVPVAFTQVRIASTLVPMPVKTSVTDLSHPLGHSFWSPPV